MLATTSVEGLGRERLLVLGGRVVCDAGWAKSTHKTLLRFNASRPGVTSMKSPHENYYPFEDNTCVASPPPQRRARENKKKNPQMSSELSSPVKTPSLELGSAGLPSTEDGEGGSHRTDDRPVWSQLPATDARRTGQTAVDM